METMMTTTDDRWQPIDTAPKDGSKIDLWVRFEERNTATRCADSSWDEEAGDWHLGPGSYRAKQYVYGVFPTHWMPIPASPTGEAE
jgi:hypothetical protein